MLLFIATPSHKGDAQVCVNWVTKLIQEIGINAKVNVVSNCPWIDVARSNLIAEFLKTECTHLFFRDDDIDIEPDVLKRMIETNVDIIVAPYRMRLKPYDWALRTEKGRVYPGLGCALISRQVITKMIEAHPELEYDEDGKKLYALFQHKFVKNKGIRKLLKEDHAFFYRIQKLGFKVNILLNAKVNHGGILSQYC